MESKSKKSGAGKLQRTPSMIGSKIHEQMDLDEYTETEKTAIMDLKKLYLDTIKLDVELQTGIYNLEKGLEPQHHAIYDKRAKLLNDFRRKAAPGDANRTDHVANFWLRVLKESYTEFVTPQDEKILVHLVDVRTKLCVEPEVKFALEFHFEPNEYFTNSVLTKTYFLNTLPNPEQPLTYDGAEIYKCEGCKINWKRKPAQDPEHKKYLYSFTSFFDFFNPPVMPQNPNDPTCADINRLLQNDFELGFYLKERVIPKAVLFFTGEIIDCQESDSESEESDDDNDEDAATGENDDNDDATLSSNSSNENVGIGNFIAM